MDISSEKLVRMHKRETESHLIAAQKKRHKDQLCSCKIQRRNNIASVGYAGKRNETINRKVIKCSKQLQKEKKD